MTDADIDQETLGQFCAITDAAPRIAMQYIRVSDNLEQAITLFYESGGAELSEGTSHASPDISTEPSGVEDDETMARRLQAEFSETNDGDVRAPISPTRDILVDPTLDNIGGMIPQFSPIGGSTRRGIFNQVQPSVWDNSEQSLAEATGGASREGEKASRLAIMYRPPFEIMTDMTFEKVREEGKRKKKWIMVTIQNMSEFFCQLLNRDVWSDSDVRACIHAADVKHNMDTVEGQQILQLYPVKHYPNLLIIDPRTGEKMKEIYDLGEPPNKGHVMMACMRIDYKPDKILDFLDRFSLDRTKKNPVSKTSVSKSVEDMTEDEQMNAALLESLKSSRPGRKRQKGIEEQSPEAPCQDLFASLKPVHREETKSNENVTRIQLRFPDGSRVVRKFDLDEPVRHIFDFILSDVECAKEKKFDVIFMGSNLLEKLDVTLADAGLKSSSLTIEYRN